MKTFREYFLENLKQWLYVIWVFPQEFIAALVISVTGAVSTKQDINGKTYEYYIAQRCNKSWSGVSLGDFIIFADEDFADEDSVKHEYGHHKQSLYLGWLYLILIGLPSVAGNLWDRVAHKDWSYKDREKWYYTKLPWEHWADVLGGVDRGF